MLANHRMQLKSATHGSLENCSYQPTKAEVGSAASNRAAGYSVADVPVATAAAGGGCGGGARVGAGAAPAARAARGPGAAAPARRVVRPAAGRGARGTRPNSVHSRSAQHQSAPGMCK